jgi:UDP-3-O-[3-hydroxymyristoyl] glucosamine N-acyltransferase
MMNTSLVIFGTGAHARKAYHCWTQAGGIVTAFADENPAAACPVPGVAMMSAADLDALPPNGQLFIAIGRAEVRQRLMDRYAQSGWQLPSLVHPRASVAPDAKLEAGVLVAAGAVVESGTQVGRGAIVDVGVIVDHDCRIAAFCHLRAGQVCPPASRWPE